MPASTSANWTKMKRLTIILTGILLVISSKQVNGQDFPVFLAIGLGEAELVGDFDPNAAMVLDGMLSSFITDGGFSKMNTAKYFVAPRIGVINSAVTGNYPVFHTVELQLSLAACDNESKDIIKSTSIIIKGSGFTYQEAMQEAIRGVRLQNEGLKQFANDVRDRIVAFYSAECSRILADAKANSTDSPYGSIGMLGTIPKASSCYDEAVALRVELIESYINQQCSQAITDARITWESSQNIQKSLTPLKGVSFSDNCYDEYLALIDEVDADIAEAIAREEAEAERERQLLDKLIKEERLERIRQEEREDQRMSDERADQRRQEERRDQLRRENRAHELNLAKVAASAVESYWKNQPSPTYDTYYIKW